MFRQMRLSSASESKILPARTSGLSSYLCPFRSQKTIRLPGERVRFPRLSRTNPTLWEGFFALGCGNSGRHPRPLWPGCTRCASSRTLSHALRDPLGGVLSSRRIRFHLLDDRNNGIRRRVRQVASKFLVVNMSQLLDVRHPNALYAIRNNEFQGYLR